MVKDLRKFIAIEINGSLEISLKQACFDGRVTLTRAGFCRIYASSNAFHKCIRLLSYWAWSTFFWSFYSFGVISSHCCTLAPVRIHSVKVLAATPLYMLSSFILQCAQVSRLYCRLLLIDRIPSTWQGYVLHEHCIQLTGMIIYYILFIICC